MSVLHAVTPHLRDALIACGLVLLGLALSFAFCAEGPVLRCADETGGVPPRAPGDSDVEVAPLREPRVRYSSAEMCGSARGARTRTLLPLLI